MNWQWFHRLGSPRWFYEKTHTVLPVLSILTALLLVIGVVWVLGFAPADSKQGNSYRIMFIHVPAAFLSLVGYYMMAIAGAVGLIWKMKLAYMAVKCAAVIGAVLTVLALLTGAVWGKPTWGTWWVWDARITSMVLLLFLYLGVIGLQSAYSQQGLGNQASAIFSLVGMINIPIIYKSVDWWASLHQPASITFTGESSIHASMLYPLLLMVVAFYLLYACLFIHWLRSEILQQEQRTQWVRAMLLPSVLEK